MTFEKIFCVVIVVLSVGFVRQKKTAKCHFRSTLFIECIVNRKILFFIVIRIISISSIYCSLDTNI